MLALDDRQMATMLAHYQRDVAWQLTLLLRDTFFDEVDPLGQDEAFRRVQADVERGTAYGLEEQDDLFLFASLSVILGWDYADNPAHRWIDAMMRDGHVGSPSMRLAIVMGQLDGQG